MFVVKKIHKLSFIITIVLSTTLIWFVMAGMASNEELRLDVNIAQPSSSALLNNFNSQIAEPINPNIVLVGLKIDDNTLARHDQNTPNELITNIPVRNVEPLFVNSTSRNTAIANNDEEQVGSIYRLRLEDGADLTAVIQTLKNNPSVAFAEPDYLAHIIATPNDPYYSGQWGLAQINAPAAWDVTTGSSDVVIAIIDSGIDVTHPDLAGQLWINPGEIAGNGLDDDNNGYIDDVHGWNIVDDNDNLSDNTGHGTQVAGIIAATSDNNIGVTGLCWQCRIMVVKVTQSGGVANYSDIAAGIAYATQKGADVINLSLGGYSDSTTLRTVLADAAETAVVVGGAGNDNDNTPFYPAAYDEYVLAVAGTTISDTKVNTSNYGTWVDVTSPGELITTTFDGSGYGTASGTSLAAPFAAGLAGLLRSTHPDWSADTIRTQIMQTTTPVDDVNSGYEGLLGSGRIDAAAALTTTAQPSLSYVAYAIDGVVNGRPEPDSTVDINIDLFNEWADATNVQATLTSTDSYVTVVNNAAAYGNIDTFNSVTNQTPFQITIAGAAPYAYDLPLTLNVTADGGYVTAVPITITTASGTEYVSGLIATDTTWSNDKQYIVTGNLLVQTGVTLTIQAGTTIKVGSGFVLRVDGTLSARGTETNTILFTSNDTEPTSGDWIGIQGFNGGIIDLAFCEISYAETAVNSSFDITQSSISHCHIHHNNVGIEAYNGLVSNNHIINNQYGILSYGSSGLLLIAHNEIAYNDNGIYSTDGSIIMKNLIHHNDYGFSGDVVGLTNGEIVSNTISGNNYGINFRGAVNGVPISYNNFGGNSHYDIYYENSENMVIPQNWWGTTDTNLIDQHIYDFQDDFNLGTVTYTPILTEPEPDAPAFLHDLTVFPANPIGIETATFDLHFSSPMDQSINPTVTFYNSRFNTWDIHQPYDMINEIAIDNNNWKWVATEGYGVAYFNGATWAYYNPYNSGLPGHYVGSLAIDTDGSKWFGTSDSGIAHFNGTTWVTYNTANSAIPADNIIAITIEDDGTKWIGTPNGVARFDDNGWTIFNTANSPLPNDVVTAISIDNDGTKWFGTSGGGLAKLSGSVWTIYNVANSDLPNNSISAIKGNDVKWIGTGNGVARLENEIWTVYNTSNSGLPNNGINDIYLELDGAIWLGTSGGGAAHLDNDTWTLYNEANSDLPSNDVRSIAIDSINKTTWFGTMTNMSSGGIGVLHGGEIYTISGDGSWVDSSHWQGLYDITSLIPRSTYSITVSAAQGTDGMEIPTDSRFGFTVDYAGEITDQTPPNPPSVIAGGVAGDASTAMALWTADDPDSAITGYRYAIGSAPGTTDIVNWTNTGDTTIRHSGLGLVEGRQYWLSVQARNNGGLWSASGYSAFVSGQPYTQVFLPIIVRN